eukprot:scaffold1091_cov164-Ochromonas_danica.AAC.44
MDMQLSFDWKNVLDDTLVPVSRIVDANIPSRRSMKGIPCGGVPCIAFRPGFKERRSREGLQGPQVSPVGSDLFRSGSSSKTNETLGRRKRVDPVLRPNFRTMLFTYPRTGYCDWEHICSRLFCAKKWRCYDHPLGPGEAQH